MFFDAHTHTNFNVYKNDSDEVIKRALHDGVWMIQVGSQKDTSERAIEIAQNYPSGVFAAVALHPLHLFDMEIDESEESTLGVSKIRFHTRAEIFDKNVYRTLAQSSKKVVAIGECGLDYFRLPHGEEDIWRARQKETLIQHFELARELRLPIMIHSRASNDDPILVYQDIFDIISEFPEVRGMMHCYLCPDPVMAKQFIDRGLYLSFSGVITFKNAHAIRDIVKIVPLKQIFSETDAPYLTPLPYRGKRNEPSFVKFVTQKIAQIKEINETEVEKQIFQNAKEFFQLPNGQL